MPSEFAPPGESAADLWVEQSNLNGVILSGVAYGVLFAISFQALLLFLKPTMGKPIQWSWVAYISLMFTLATLGFAGNVKFNQLTYIDQRNIPGGPNAYTAQYYSIWVNMMSFGSYVVMSWVADALVLWRFSLIWNYNYRLCIFPVCIWLATISMSIALLVAMTRPGADFWSENAVNFGIAYWSLSISLNIILTCMIVSRILYFRQRSRNLLGQRSEMYTSVVAMLIESSSLYSIWGLVFVIAYARGSPFQNLVLPPLGQVQGIAPILILFRVAQGRAWSNKTAQTISWGPSTAYGSQSTQSAGGTAIALSNLKTSKPTTIHVTSTTITETDKSRHETHWDTNSQTGSGKLPTAV
ncbi:hypothetical protein BDZ89DRAFT_965115 [Hymenopellis radicata]|nr:hypothetical protein BDZ89DRAFT_965115 [Hymenopellis radicata]